MNRKEKCFFFQSPLLLSFTTVLYGYVQHCLLFYYTSLLLLYTPAPPPYYHFLSISSDLLTSYFLPEYGLETGFNTCKCPSSQYCYVLCLFLG